MAAPALNEDVVWYIWKIYNTNHVLDELMKTYDSVWRDPSLHLQCLVCDDMGSLQHKHNDLWEMIEDHNMHFYNECIDEKCPNCQVYGFPCANLAAYGFENEKLGSIWTHVNF